MQSSRYLRPAIAMIELIFALLVMAIVMMGAPRLMQIASQSSFTTTQQEAISEAASEVNMILGYAWDENDTNSSFIPPILQVINSVSDLNESGTSGRRRGTPKESTRSFVRNDGQRLSASPSSTFGHGGGQDSNEATEDDIDDFSGTAYNLTVIENAGTIDNVDSTISIAVSVSYMADTTPISYQSGTLTFNPFTGTVANSSNTKHIQVTLTSTSGIEELEKKIVLHAFSCNIGGYKLEERDF